MNRKAAESWANAVYQLWLRDMIEQGVVRLVPPPTRTEIVKHVWDTVRDFWMESSVDGKLVVQADPTEEEFVFEIIRYDRHFVIECEGVVVEKMPVIG